MPQQRPTEGTIRVRPPKRAGLPYPTAANLFLFSWSGGIEVEMAIGYLDFMPDPNLKPNAVMEREPVMAHRVFMSIRGFAQLASQVREASTALEAAGVPLERLMSEMTLDPTKR